ERQNLAIEGRGEDEVAGHDDAAKVLRVELRGPKDPSRVDVDGVQFAGTRARVWKGVGGVGEIGLEVGHGDVDYAVRGCDWCLHATEDSRKHGHRLSDWDGRQAVVLMHANGRLPDLAAGCAIERDDVTALARANDDLARRSANRRRREDW